MLRHGYNLEFDLITCGICIFKKQKEKKEKKGKKEKRVTGLGVISIQVQAQVTCLEVSHAGLCCAMSTSDVPTSDTQPTAQASTVSQHATFNRNAFTVDKKAACLARIQGRAQYKHASKRQTQFRMER